MPSLSDIPVELSAMIGTARLPLGELTRLGRGAVVSLGVSPDSEVALHAGGQPVATGELSIEGERIAITVRQLLREGD